MEIAIKQIVDYIRCPMLYKQRWIIGTDEIFINVWEKYDHDIHKTVYNFFALLQNGDSVGINQLKKAWGSLWLGNRTGHELILGMPTSWRNSANTRRKEGIDALNKFYKDFKDRPGFPLAINHPYKVDVGNDIIVTGTWELIREVEDLPGQKVIEIVDFKVDDKLHNKVHRENDLELTVMSYAFRKTFNEKEDRVLFYGMHKGGEQIVTRGESDYEYMKYNVQQVAKSIQAGIFYARAGDHCYTCPYRRECEKNLHNNLMKGDIEMPIELPGMGIMNDDGTTKITNKDAIKDIKDSSTKVPDTVSFEDNDGEVNED